MKLAESWHVSASPATALIQSKFYTGQINVISCFQPTPLYVMDEIDAALDFKNVSIVANYIKGTD